MKPPRDTFSLRPACIACTMVLVGYLASPSSVAAQQSITTPGVPVEQNFDSLGTSVTATLPTGWRVGTDWTAGATATALAYGTSGAGVVTLSSSGGIVNWANGVTASSTLRALGFLNTGNFTSPRSIIYAFQNDTGAAVTSLTINWAYEKYRSGTRAWNWTFFHGSTSSPSTSAVDGDQSYAGDTDNATIFNPPTATAKSVTITGLNIPNGSAYYLRWTLTGVGGSSNGQGLGVNNFAVTLTASTSPTITAAPSSLPSFLTFVGTPSSSQSFTVSGSNLTADIAITAPAGFELSLASGGSYSGNLALTPSAGSVASTTIFARLTGASIGNPSGNIALTSAGATPQNVAVTGTITPLPSVTLSTTGPLNLGTVVQGNVSSPQTFTVQGSNLAGNILITPPTGCEISSDSGATWNASTLIIAPVGGSVPLTTISVRISASAGPGSVNGNVSVATAGTTPQNVAVTGTVTAAPTITPNPTTLTAMTTVVGAPSSPRNFTVTGNDLSGVVTVGAPTGFELSLASGGPYFSSLTLTPSAAGVIASTTIYARLTGASIGSPAGDISLSGGGAATKTVAVSGTVTPPPPLLTAAPASLTGFSTIQGTASAAQTVTVGGTNLTADVIVTAPAKYEVSTNNGTSYGVTATLVPTSGTLASTNLLVRVAASAASGAATGTLTVASTGATTRDVGLSGTVIPPPSMQLIVPAILPAAGQTLGYVVLSAPAAGDVVVSLESSEPSTLQLPPSVTVPVGLKVASFTITTISVESDVPASILASAPGFASTTANTRISRGAVLAAPLSLDEDGIPTAYEQDFAEFNSTRPVLPLGWRATSGGVPSSGSLTFGSALSPYSAWASTNVGVKFSSDFVRVFGIQHGSGGTAGQSVILRNDTGTVLTGLRIRYAGRTTRSAADPDNPAAGNPAYDVKVGVGSNINALTWSQPILSLKYSTSNLDNQPREGVLSGVTIPDGQFAVVAWTSTGSNDAKQIGVSDIVVAPIVPTISVTPEAGRNDFITSLGTPSDPARALFIRGGGLTGGVNITAPAGFEVSTSSNTGFSATVTLSPAAGAVDSWFYVRLKGEAVGAVQGNLTFASAGAGTVSVPVGGVVFAAGTSPQVLASTTALLPFATEVTQRSPFQTFSVSAQNISTNPVVLNAPQGFEISRNSGSNYGPAVSILPTAGAIKAVPVYVRMIGLQEGVYSPRFITIANALVPDIPGVSVSGTVGPPQPTIFVNPSTLPIMVAGLGAPSQPQSFVVSGRDLTGDVAITAPNGFQISLDPDPVPVENWVEDIVLNRSGGALAPTTVYVRLTGEILGEFAGFVEASSSGALRKLVAVTGTVDSAPVITPYPPVLNFEQTYVSKASNPQALDITGRLLALITRQNPGVPPTPSDPAAPVPPALGIRVTAPAGFQVSSSTATPIPEESWVTVLDLTTGSTATLVTTIQVRVAPDAPALSPLEGLLILTSGPTIATVALNGGVCPQPSVSATPTALSGFETVLGRPSSPAQTFTVSGADLQGAVGLQASAGYEISTNNVTWSTNISLARQIPPSTVTALDNAGNYSGGWTDGSNDGTGFAPWVINADQGTGFAGNFIGDPNAAGVTGMGTQAFGLYANPVGSGAFVDVRRDFSVPLDDGETFSFQWGVNWDSGAGNKGFNIFAGGTQVANVNMGGFPGDITFNGGNTAIAFGTGPMTWSATYSASGSLEVTSTGRGDGGVVFRTNIVVPVAPTGFSFYTSAMEAGDQRQAYFNNLKVGTGGGSGCDDAFVPDTTIYVRLTGAAPTGNRAGTVTVESLGATSRTVTLNGVVWTISGDPNELTFYSVVGYDSNPQLVTIGGASRPTAARVTPPPGFIVRDPVNGAEVNGAAPAPGNVLTLAGNTVEVRVSSTAAQGPINSQLLLGAGSWSDAGAVQLRGRVGQPAENDIFIDFIYRRLLYRAPTSEEMDDALDLLGAPAAAASRELKTQMIMELMGYVASDGIFDWTADYAQISVAFAPFARLVLVPTAQQVMSFVDTVRNGDPTPLPFPATFNGLAGAPWWATRELAQAMTDFMATPQFSSSYPAVSGLDTREFYNWMNAVMFPGRAMGSQGPLELTTMMNTLTTSDGRAYGRGAGVAFRSVYVSVLLTEARGESDGSDIEKPFQRRMNLAVLNFRVWGPWSYSAGSAEYSQQNVLNLLRVPQVTSGALPTFAADAPFPGYSILATNGTLNPVPSGPSPVLYYSAVNLPAGLSVIPSTGAILQTGPVVPGAYNYIVLSAQNYFGTGSKTVSLTVEPPQVGPASQWMMEKGVSGANFAAVANDDNDRDGLSNTQEYAFGLDPLRPNSRAFSSKVNGSSMIMEWNALKTGATYRVEQSDNLSTWQNVDSPAPQPMGDIDARYRLWSIELPVSGAANFYRIEVEFAPGALE